MQVLPWRGAQLAAADLGAAISRQSGAVALIAALCWCSIACGSGPVQSPLPLTTIAEVTLSGSTSRWDYASLDAPAHLLFLAHLGDSVVTVLDTRSNRIVADIPDVGHVHGVLAVPELGRIYASATRSDEVVAIDEKTLQITARIPGGDYPDGMADVPAVQKLYVSDETGGTETVIDTHANRRIATIPLGGEAGNTQYDPLSGHIFVNVQSRRQLVEINPATDQVLARDELPGARGNHGLLIEPALRRAFIACEDNDRLLVFDLRTRRVLDAFDVGHEPDVLAYDPALGLLYVASESGVVSLFRSEDGSVRKLGEGLLAPNAHVVAVDPATHYAYFPIRNLSGRPVLLVTRPQL